MTSPTGVRVTAYPRIHMSLIDLGRSTLRAYGGAGFFLDGPVTVVESRPSSVLELSGFDGRADSRTVSDLRSALARLEMRGTGGSVHISLQELPPQHVGLGSKTALLLAALESASLAVGLGLSKEELQALSRRGGTSGIGVNGYFTGGFVCDGGHPQHQVPEFVPSAENREDFASPPLLVRCDFPSNWRALLLLPERGAATSGAEEVEFFREITPIPASEVLTTLAAIYHGVAPAVATCDLHSLRQSLADLHSAGFKTREVARHAVQTQELLAQLRTVPEAACGMSSMGPLVYAIVEEGNEATCEALRKVAEHAGVTSLGWFGGSSRGREVSRVP